MRKPHLGLLAFLALSLLVGSRPAIAGQRRGGAHVQGPKVSAAVHGNAAAAQFRQMQQQQQQFQKALKQQARMEHQAQKQHPRGSQATKGNTSSATRSKKGRQRSQSAATTHDAEPTQGTQESGHANPQAHTAAPSTPPASATQPKANPGQPDAPATQASGTTPTSMLQQNPQTARPASVLGPNPTNTAATVPTAQQPLNPQPATSTTTTPTTATTTTPAATTTATGTPVTTNPNHRVGGGMGMNGARNRLPGAMNQGVINHLRMAYSRLQQADHDYQGHRARAASHVVNALRHLGASTMSGSGINPGAGRMPQAQSDGLLRDALFRLNTAQSELGSRGNMAAAHHGSARSQVVAAIGEINAALNIR
ncbi:MAG TPA: hypothetical protein VFF52_25675 [Isosphaeraceae bacterium]|nr:hypothetical protein [Isosphaeraceae bacterium]